MSWRDLVLRVMRVPPEPEPPPGSPPRVFRAAQNYFVLLALRWLVLQVAALIGLLFAVTFFQTAVAQRVPSVVVTIFHAIEIFGAIALVFQAAFGWMVVRLDYELRWYMLSDRAIRIREGISTVREKTIALANVQNISIHQGPLQRLLGIADVEVKTAGGGSSSPHEKKSAGFEPMHVAYFRGVDDANEIRDLVREGVRRQRNAGLGDPDEHHHATVTPSGTDARAAALELLAEARRLRYEIEN